MNALEQLLHEVTPLLMGPVLLALVALLVWTLLTAGGFLKELQERRRANGEPGLVARFRRESAAAGADAMSLELLADRCEIDGSRLVTRLNLVARAAPTLGLMATLIPMGPALLSLAEDDVESLARSLAVAFTATVAGLLVGLLAAVMGSVRRQWYASDMVAIDAIVARRAKAVA